MGAAFQFIKAEASASTLLMSKQGMHTWVNIVICIYSYVLMYSKYTPQDRNFQSRLCPMTIFTRLDHGRYQHFEWLKVFEFCVFQDLFIQDQTLIHYFSNRQITVFIASSLNCFLTCCPYHRMSCQSVTLVLNNFYNRKLKFKFVLVAYRRPKFALFFRRKTRNHPHPLEWVEAVGCIRLKVDSLL